MSNNNCFLIIPAGGSGSRINSLIPKQYLILENGLSILDCTLKKFFNINEIIGCIIAISKDNKHFDKSLYKNHKKILAVVQGGEKRCHSVMNSLKVLSKFAKQDDWVLVHDAVRPFVKIQDIKNLINTAKKFKQGAILASPVIDTLKLTNNNKIKKTINREYLFQAQTPQIFKFARLLEALENAIDNNLNITDEAQAIEEIGDEINIIISSKKNIKITTKNDIDLANYYIGKNEN